MNALRRTTAVWAAVAAAVYLALFLFLDQRIDQWAYVRFAGTWVFDLGTTVSSLATGGYIRLALALCFALIIIVDPRLSHTWTRKLLYVCVSCAIAVTFADGVKYLLGRCRPVLLFEQELYGFTFLSSDWATNSSPSGHTTRAFAVLTATSMLYRRLASLFICIAVLIGISRVIVTAHYPSDVVFGAFIGVFAALWTYKFFPNLSGPVQPASPSA